MTKMSRRTFLNTTGRVAAGAVVGGLVLAAKGEEKAPPPSNRVRLAMIGCGGRGSYVMRGLAEAGGQIVTLCDLRQNRLDSCTKFLAEVQKDAPTQTKEMQKVFDDKNIDAIIVATPDRWHAPATIRACQAGKDVYVEKPHSHNIWESGKTVEAARKYNRIVQVGTQSRSGPYTIAARDYVASGKLGKIGIVKVFNMKSGGPFKLGEPGTPPAGFNWDAWLGAAPERPFHQQLVGSGWHQFWDFCGGDLCDDSIHQLDLALMVLGDPAPPKSVRGVGGRYVHRGDDSEVPDVQAVNWDYDKFLMTYENTGYPRYMEKTSITIRRNDLFPYWTMNSTRIEIYGSELLMTLGRHGGGWIVQQSGGGTVEKMYGRPCDEPHYANFLECVRSRKKPNADIGIAHTSLLAAHMGNIATRLGGTALNFDAAKVAFDKPEANVMARGTYRKGYEISDAV